MFFKKLEKSWTKNKSRGFTMVELLVVIAIFLIITGVVIVDIPNFRNKSALDLTASEVATYIRGAQVYGSAQKDTAQGATSVYGVDLNTNASEFYLFKNTKPDPNTGLPTPQETYKIKGFSIGGIAVKKSSNATCLPEDTLDVTYKSSDYAVNLGTAMEAGAYTDFVDTNPDQNKIVGFEFADIKIISQSDSSLFKCVRIYQNGQVTLSDCVCA